MGASLGKRILNLLITGFLITYLIDAEALAAGITSPTSFQNKPIHHFNLKMLDDRTYEYYSKLENVTYDPLSRVVNFESQILTENTRACYPIEYIPDIEMPCVGGHPRNIIFLTCDAFGILPPVSRLTPAQAMYHFISGYTAKIAGTEVGINEPQATFSACFGAAFMVWHPSKYAEILAKRIRENGTKVWFINTGWTGGPYGVGKRFPLKYTRAIVNAINGDVLNDVPTVEDSTFGFGVPTQCPGIPSELMTPSNSWTDRREYEKKAATLAQLFKTNFKKFEAGTNREVKEAGPK